ncbi:hypothetical protein M8494_22130 [Serratia ureilytica]
MTDQQGLYTADPRNNPQAERSVSARHRRRAAHHRRRQRSGTGTGGMGTKLQAADVACRAGIDVVTPRAVNRAWWRT